ncbi:carboxypeptidase-like regulatory domain-containing protein [Maribellus sp. YY47]|uniref:carboxypeptidase-like regulatory domain-containing protein n=1 Tax=Maribellus sp. YY47 TaxID=2929486 RepID=UPI002000D87A|nr:carboxypeptidase-like regulatory domain-containing protein [Maribellus sp. YY47]MCK3686411.1 carboxypeptidase-like regulatory domain-containing protein [Maribellus sp. YY47]
MKTIISVILVFTCSLVALADKKDNKPADSEVAAVSLSGKVTDEKTGETLVGVEVKLEGTDKKCYTGFDGEFSFNDVKPGNYNITASYISYEKCELQKQNIDIFSTQLEVKLTPVQ